MPTTETTPLPADILLERIDDQGLRKEVLFVKEKGLVDYGEPLTTRSCINDKPLTPISAMREALHEAIDSACYAIVASQATPCRLTRRAIEVAVSYQHEAIVRLYTALRVAEGHQP